MKAVIFQEHGGIENLVYTDFPMPEVSSNQVLINIKAVALNHLDLFVRKSIPGLNLELPHILGRDIAGIITALGPSIHRFRIGQKVIVDPIQPKKLN